MSYTGVIGTHTEQPELRHWRRSPRLRMLFVRVAVLTIVVCVAILTAFYALRLLERDDERADGLRLSANALIAEQIDEETGIRGYALTLDQHFLEPYTSRKADLERGIDQLTTTLPAESAEFAIVGRFASLHRSWEIDIAQPVIRNPAAGRDLALQRNGKTLVDAMRALMASLDGLAQRALTRNTQRTHLVQYAEALTIVIIILSMGIYAYMYERRALSVQERAFAAIEETSHSATRIGEWRMKVIAMLAHDFKSALAVISACADVLKEFPERRNDPGPYEGIHESVEELSEMTDEALLLARIASDVLPIKRERVEIATVLNSVAARYRTSHPIHVHVRNECVTGDEAYLLRAFDNLVSNATKYSAPLAPVDIETRRDGDHIEVVIRDRGEGIDPEDIPHIFEEYWRSPHATGAVGAGVGLFIVKKIIDAHDGSIDVISLPGIGTTLYVRLPACDVQPPEAGPPQSGV